MQAAFSAESRRLASLIRAPMSAPLAALRMTVRETAMNSAAGMPFPETSATVKASRSSSIRK